MGVPVSMTKEEGDVAKAELLKSLVTIIGQKLNDLLGGADECLEVRSEMKQRLIEQMERTAAGERGASLQDARPEAGIE